jgi:hypothetical protein
MAHVFVRSGAKVLIKDHGVLVQSDISPQEQWRLGGSRLGPYGQRGILLTKVARPTSFIFRNFVSFYLNVLIMNSTGNDYNTTSSTHCWKTETKYLPYARVRVVQLKWIGFPRRCPIWLTSGSLTPLNWSHAPHQAGHVGCSICLSMVVQ